MMAGQLVMCPHCRESFRQPGAISTVPAQALPLPVQEQRPVNILVAGPQPQPRLRAEGWFTRAFSTTSGVLVAVLLFLIVLPLLLCGGLLFIGALVGAVDKASQFPDAQEAVSGTVPPAIVSQAQSAALPQLRRMGLRRFEGASSVKQHGDTLTLTGKSPDEAGTLRPISFTFDTSGDEWELIEYSLDGKTYRRK
jgi:hypothetical protein